MLKDRLCLGEEVTLIKQGPSTLLLTEQTLDLGLHNVCSGMYKCLGSLHFMCIELTINSAGPLFWSFLGYVGLLLLQCMSSYTANNAYIL